MKQIATIAMLVLFSLGVQAQKCKPFDTYKDEFKDINYEFWGGKLDYKKNMLAGTATYVSLRMYSSEEYIILALRVEIIQGANDAAVNNIFMGDSSQFMLKTDAGIMEFTAETVGRHKGKIAEKTQTITDLSVPITKEQVVILANNPILMYKVMPVNYSVIQGDVNEKKAGKVQAQLKCYTNS